MPVTQPRVGVQPAVPVAPADRGRTPGANDGSRRATSDGRPVDAQGHPISPSIAQVVDGRIIYVPNPAYPAGGPRATHVARAADGRPLPASMRGGTAAGATASTPTAGAAGGGTPPVDPNAAADAAEGRNAQALIAMFLADYGLEGLDLWLTDMISQGKSPAEMRLLVRETEQYKKRFPGMAAIKAGGHAPISEDTYIDYEKTSRILARAYGVPHGMIDTPEAIAENMGKGFSAGEVQTRIERGYAKVASAPAAVRQVFGEWYGADGDNALAAFFLDPSKAQPILERYVGTGSIGGTARSVGVALRQAKAGQLHDVGQSAESVQPRLGALFARRSLFDETVTEYEDLRLEEEGVDAAFSLTPDAQGLIDRRLDQRVATTQGGGGAQLGRTGTGFGSAKR